MDNLEIIEKIKSDCELKIEGRPESDDIKISIYHKQTCFENSRILTRNEIEICAVDAFDLAREELVQSIYNSIYAGHEYWMKNFYLST